MLLEFRPLIANIDHLETLFDEMDRQWLAHGQTASLKPELEKKREMILKREIDGIIGFEEDSPVALAWVDLPNGCYGNAVVHCTRPELEPPLIQALHETGLLTGNVVELVQIVKGFSYRDAFIALGYKEKERQRMTIELKDYPEPEPLEGVVCDVITEESVPNIAQISHMAHDTRKHIEGYRDFSSIASRSNMASKMRAGDYGAPLQSACLHLTYNGTPAAIVDVLDIEFWGESHVAWIMDVAVIPEYQGFGLAQYMIKKSLHEASKAGSTISALAVTLSNKPAVRLYESLGYECVEYFVEIIPPGVIETD
ncbi:GNAT family N-acetyltransferase [bacterium]|jgi:GNAT superfamily N-acetyltransferase|nr:GNAT family N-acetyltransferase [bacterium]